MTLHHAISFVPGPLAVWLGQWFNLFEMTRIANPAWQSNANNLGLALSAIAALVIVAKQQKLAQYKLANGASFAFCVSLLLALICVTFFISLDYPRSMSASMALDHAWYVAYLLFLLSLSLTLSLAASALARTIK